MFVNWPIIFFLFFLAFPGVYIVVPRFINFLLPHNSDELKKRFTRIITIQTLLMILLMSAAGSVLSLATGLGDPLLKALLHEKITANLTDFIPVLILTAVGLSVFLLIYYGWAARSLDPKTFQVMKNLRQLFGLDGCLLYSGIAEEIIARWGLMNVLAFFVYLLTGQKGEILIWIALLTSGLLVAIGHLPAFIAAGCSLSRSFITMMIILFMVQGILFGWIFWHYGLLAAIFSHMLFHLGWFLYDRN